MKKVAGLDEEKTKQVRCVKRPGLDRLLSHLHECTLVLHSEEIIE